MAEMAEVVAGSLGSRSREEADVSSRLTSYFAAEVAGFGLYSPYIRVGVARKELTDDAKRSPIAHAQNGMAVSKGRPIPLTLRMRRNAESIDMDRTIWPTPMGDVYGFRTSARGRLRNCDDFRLLALSAGEGGGPIRTFSRLPIR